MKKTLNLLMITMLAFTGCSEDDAPGVVTPNTVQVTMPSEVKTFSGPNFQYEITSFWQYNGQQLVSTGDSNGNYREYTYDNNFIKTIKTYLANGTLHSLETFVYNVDDQLTSSIITSSSTGEKHVYTHNTDNTISVTTYEGTNTVQDNVQSTGTITFQNGEVVKTETFYDDGVVRTNIFTYDDKKKPTANVQGFDKISFAYANARERKGALHNMLTDTQTYMMDEATVVERIYTYNAEGYPLTIFNDSPLSFERYKIEYTYESYTIAL
jgi:hypothetical protein